MDTNITKNFRPTDRDYEILQHLSRYRLTTREVLHSQFFDDSDISAVSKVTSRLCDVGWLNRYEFGNRVYFVVGPTGAKYLGVGLNKTAEFGAQAFIENFAFLQFCFCCEVPRERLLVKELAELLGDLKGKKLSSGMFYIDFEQGQRLAALRVDHGSDPAHILRRTRAHLEHLVAHPKIAELFRRQEFLMCILTSLPEKKREIDDAIARQIWQVAFKVEVVPGLAPIIVDSIIRRRQGGGTK